MLGVFAGFLVIFILPLKYALRIGVPVACVSALLCILPTMILRYNIPKLMVAYERAKRTIALKEKQEKNAEKEEASAEEKTETVETQENSTENEVQNAESESKTDTTEEK